MLQIGSMVKDTYKILSEIGKGGMSVVYMAINERANKTWAIKEVRKDGKMAFQQVKQGLLAEIETLKKLKHQNLPSIADVIDDEDSFIIVMDYIEGLSLDKIVNEPPTPQSEEDVVKWALQLCDVFGYLHAQNPPMIYRDLKPANIMLKPNGDIMLIDFGTVKTVEYNAGETTGIGTMGYAAPEQYINSGLGRTDARTDIYCLGMTLYHLLTAINPATNLIDNKSIRAVNPALSHGLDAIIQKCTRYQPDERYQTCAELKYDLENYDKLEPQYRKRQKHRMATFIAPTVASILFAVGGLSTSMIASKMANDTYAVKIEDAVKTTSYSEKVKLYQECIDIPNMAGEKDAYLGLIQTFKEDNVFTIEEANQLEMLLRNNRTILKQNPNTYTEICFETGKLFWYYYDYGNGSNNQLTRTQSSVEWFQDVLDNAPEGYANLNMAKVYSNIGKFNRDITTNITEASETGKFRPLFDDLNNLLREVAIKQNENEIVRLEILELSRLALQQYATKFKVDGVTKAEMDGMLDRVQATTQSIVTNSEKTEIKQQNIISNLDETRTTIENAYATNQLHVVGGGDQS